MLAERDEFNIKTEEMVKAGLHFGRKTSNVHPKMKPFLYGIRNTIYIIDSNKTREKLIQALEFIKKIILEKRVLMVVGTKIQIKGLVESFAKECGLPYVSEKWLGGTFTNFEVMKKRIDYLKDLEKKVKSEEFLKYTKKERSEIEEEIRELELKFGGIKNMEKLPDAVLVLDMDKNALAIKESKMKGIKVIGLANTNIDPTLVDFPIPGNDNAISSVKYILDKIKDVILKARQEAENEKEDDKH